MGRTDRRHFRQFDRSGLHRLAPSPPHPGRPDAPGPCAGPSASLCAGRANPCATQGLRRSGKASPSPPMTKSGSILREHCLRARASV